MIELRGGCGILVKISWLMIQHKVARVVIEVGLVRSSDEYTAVYFAPGWSLLALPLVTRCGLP